MSNITIINIVVGIWWGVANAFLFYRLMGGGFIYELDVTIATFEFAVAIIGTCWFLWQIPYWIIKMRRRKREMNK